MHVGVCVRMRAHMRGRVRVHEGGRKLKTV